MGKEKRKEIVESICEDLGEYKNILITDYRGMDVNSLSDLRGELRKYGVRYRVLKNTLMKIALERHNILGLDEYLKGPSGVIFNNDGVHVSKVLMSRLNEGVLKVKGGYVDGGVIGFEEVKKLSEIPSKDVLIGRLLYTLNSGLYRLMNLKVLLLSKLLRVLGQISLQKK